MSYVRLGRWIDWQLMKRGALLTIVDPREDILRMLSMRFKTEGEHIYRIKTP
jgi:hypothetical protein